MKRIAHLTLTLEVEITVSDITEESVRHYYRHHTNYEKLMQCPETWQHAGMQNRLLLALLDDPQALDKFLTFLVTDKINPNEDSPLGDIFQVNEEDEILALVYDRLSSEDAEFFRKASEEGYLWENIRLLSESFGLRWTEASLVEVRDVQRGCVEIASESQR